MNQVLRIQIEGVFFDLQSNAAIAALNAVFLRKDVAQLDCNWDRVKNKYVYTPTPDEKRTLLVTVMRPEWTLSAEL